MNIQQTTTKLTPNIELKHKYNKLGRVTPINDEISFTSKFVPTKDFSKQKFFNKLFKKNLYKCKLDKLEGAQSGLKSFEGLTMK